MVAESTRKLSVLSRANCRFPDGTLHPLYVTGLSLDGASLLASEAPHPGETVEVTIEPTHLAPLPTIKAMVTRIQNDVASVEHNGFEIAFFALDQGIEDRLASALIALDAAHLSLPASVERRGEARIGCRLEASVKISSRTYSGVIMDLSVTGALVCVAADAFDAPPARGAELRLLIAAPDSRKRAGIGARVAWTTVASGQQLLGVQFDRRDSEALIGVRDLIFDVLTPLGAGP